MRFLLKCIFLVVVSLGMQCRDVGIQTATPTDDHWQTPRLSEPQKEVLRSVFLADFQSEIAELLDRHLQRHRFHGNVLLSQHGQVVFERSTGYADPNQKLPLEADVPFQLASVSKQFTAFAALLLEYRNQLSLEDYVQQWIPAFPYHQVKVRHLVYHTSGLPNYLWFLDHHPHPSPFPNNAQLVDWMSKKKPSLHFKPGQRFEYSNTGYVVLAHVIEKASGVVFSTFLKDEIFCKLGMNQSFVFSPSAGENPKDRLMGFEPMKRGYMRIPDTEHDGCVGDKGVFSTVHDLHLWDQSLRNGTLLPQTVLAAAFQRGALDNQKPINYAMGFRLKDFLGSSVIYHDGLWHGFRNTFLRDTLRDQTIIVLSHASCKSKNQLVEELAQHLLKMPPWLEMMELVELLVAGDTQKALELYARKQPLIPLEWLYETSQQLQNWGISAAAEALAELPHHAMQHNIAITSASKKQERIEGI